MIFFTFRSKLKNLKEFFLLVSVFLFVRRTYSSHTEAVSKKKKKNFLNKLKLRKQDCCGLRACHLVHGTETPAAMINCKRTAPFYCSCSPPSSTHMLRMPNYAHKPPPFTEGMREHSTVSKTCWKPASRATNEEMIF